MPGTAKLPKKPLSNYQMTSKMTKIALRNISKSKKNQIPGVLSIFFICFTTITIRKTNMPGSGNLPKKPLSKYQLVSNIDWNCTKK